MIKRFSVFILLATLVLFLYSNVLKGNWGSVWFSHQISDALIWYNGSVPKQVMVLELRNLFLLFLCYSSFSRSIPLQMQYKISVLKKIAKFTIKQLSRSLFFNKKSPPANNFIKKETPTHLFSHQFCKVSRKTFFIEHLRATASYYRSLLLVLT